MRGINDMLYLTQYFWMYHWMYFCGHKLDVLIWAFVFTWILDIWTMMDFGIFAVMGDLFFILLQMRYIYIYIYRFDYSLGWDMYVWIYDDMICLLHVYLYMRLTCFYA